MTDWDWDSKLKEFGRTGSNRAEMAGLASGASNIGRYGGRKLRASIDGKPSKTGIAGSVQQPTTTHGGSEEDLFTPKKALGDMNADELNAEAKTRSLASMARGDRPVDDTMSMQDAQRYNIMKRASDEANALMQQEDSSSFADAWRKSQYGQTEPGDFQTMEQMYKRTQRGGLGNSGSLGAY